MVGSEQSRKPRFLEKIEKPPARPATPSIVSPTGDLSLEKDIAAITLQQLVRGRAIQTQMFEGKEKRRELIAELRSTHALLEDDKAEKRRQKLSILSTQEEHAKLIHEDKQVDDILSRFECGSLAEMLDFLSKELDRLIEERRVHALVLLAERNRRMREAEESGTRQREERRRREQDEIFKQIVKVHQETVDGYLANVAGLAIDSTAGMIAQAEVEEFAQKLDAAAQQLEAERDERRSDLIAADLVYNFLIPEVNKRAYQIELDARQRKFLQAAHREIWIPTHEAADAEREPVSGQSASNRQHNSTMTSPVDENPTVQDGPSCDE
ncbi:AMY-1-associating protein expressed in testis 1 [Paragonimus westermani]|uniref:AMY-1-associating protein expressed in testis 1 n=1 Tax=Paragonimus westermani TaxID=34504 RepID=A0A8T0CY78_9TREM|nr:AMY-1-associating protein expressed in testis 1 [Paragonimus westermani]